MDSPTERSADRGLESGASRRQDLCTHPSARADIFLGADTGEQVCPACGATGTAAELRTSGERNWRRLEREARRRRLPRPVALALIVAASWVLAAVATLVYIRASEDWHRTMVVTTLSDLRDAVAYGGCELVANPEMEGRRVGYVRCPSGPLRAVLEDARARVSGLSVLPEPIGVATAP